MTGLVLGVHARREREKTVAGLPVVWRGRSIEEPLEGTQLYMDYMAPAIYLCFSLISAPLSCEAGIRGQILSLVLSGRFGLKPSFPRFAHCFSI